MTVTLVKLREGRQRRLTTWTVEAYRGPAPVYSHTFKDRGEARQYARRLASEHNAVVVLAGPAKVAAIARGAAL